MNIVEAKTTFIMVTEEQSLAIYESSIHFDGFNICNFPREIFEAWQAGGITGVSCTCNLWEGLRGSLANVVRWKEWFEEHSDLIVQAGHCLRPEPRRSTEDVIRYASEGKPPCFSYALPCGLKEHPGTRVTT